MKWFIKCFKQYFDFKGRARRKEYWMFTLFLCIFSSIISIIGLIIELSLNSYYYIQPIVDYIQHSNINPIIIGFGKTSSRHRKERMVGSSISVTYNRLDMAVTMGLFR